MRNRFYPTLSALHEDPVVRQAPNLPDAGWLQNHVLVWNGGTREGSENLRTFENEGARAYPDDVVQAARMQIVAALVLGGVAGYMIGKRRR